MVIEWKYTEDNNVIEDGLYLCQCKSHFNYFLNWNSVDNCWDDQEGDDFECSYEDMERYISVKTITNFLDRKTGQHE